MPTVRDRRSIRLLVGAAIATAALAASARSGTPGPGTPGSGAIQERVLPNGLRLIMKPAHALALAAIQVWIRVGSYRETPETSGYSHLIEHLVFKGGEGRATGELDQAIEDLGGLLVATTEKDWTTYAATVASRDAGRVIQLMGNALRTAAFRPEDYRLERGVVLDEIQQADADPERLITRLLFEQAFAHHPYRLDARGAAPVIARVDLAALRAWYERYYHPANMSVIVVGDIDPAAIARQVEAAFATTRPAPPPEPLPPAEIAGAAASRREIELDTVGAYVGLAFPAPAVSDQPDVYAMDLILTLLAEGDYGRLPAALRGQVTSVETSFTTRRQPGLFIAFAATDAENLAAVEATLRTQIEKLSQEVVPEPELTMAKRLLAGSLALDHETYSSQANLLGFYEAIDSWRFAATYLERVQAITPAEIRACAQKYLRADRACALIARPKARPRAAEGASAPLLLGEGRP